MTAKRPPVTDWASDFDHLDPRWVRDPYPIWDTLREECPVAHTQRYGGAYFPTKFEDIRAVAYDTVHFSSQRVSLRLKKAEPAIPSPPITSDPPHHRSARMTVLPPFTPKAVKVHEDAIRSICDRLIDKFIHQGHCDAAVDYAQEITTRTMAALFGVSEDIGPQFRTWIYESLELGLVDLDVYKRATKEIDDYLAAEVHKRRQQPSDDLISYLMKTEHEGKTLSDDDVISSLRLLMIAGIDTTWSAIGASIWHLSTHPEDVARLVAEPELLPTAIEEFLRAYAPVTMAREIKTDVEIGGCPMKAGEMVVLSFPSANRDSSVFPDPERVIIDRKINQHAAFGLGIHRCVGSNLARTEMLIALQQWLARIPKFRLDPTKEMTWSESHVRGPRLLPIILEEVQP